MNKFLQIGSCQISGKMLFSLQTFALSPHVTNSFKRRGRLFRGESLNDWPLTFSRLVVEATQALSHTLKTARAEHRLHGRRVAGIRGGWGFRRLSPSLNESLGALDLGQLFIRPARSSRKLQIQPRRWMKTPQGELKTAGRAPYVGSLSSKTVILHGQPSFPANVTTAGSY